MLKSCTLSGYDQSVENVEKSNLNLYLATTEVYENVNRKAEVNYATEEVEFEGGVWDHEGKVFEPVKRREYEKRFDCKKKIENEKEKPRRLKPLKFILQLLCSIVTEMNLLELL